MDLPRPLLVLVLVVGLAAAGLAVDELSGSLGPDEARVTFLDADGTRLGVVTVRVSDTFRERYVGLSATESLGPDEGMLFVHEREDRHAYVMRDMAFPIDIVFVGADRRITAIHHAEVEEPPLTRYRGRGKWVIEVPYEWTTRHGVLVGDRVRIVRGDRGPGSGSAES